MRLSGFKCSHNTHGYPHLQWPYMQLISPRDSTIRPLKNGKSGSNGNEIDEANALQAADQALPLDAQCVSP